MELIGPKDLATLIEDLKAFAKAEDRRILLLSGAFLEEQVTLCALEALVEGFDVHLLCDLMSARDHRLKPVLLLRLFQAGAVPSSLRQFLYRWQAAEEIRNAVVSFKKHGKLIHQSDRGAQYVSIRYTERQAEAGIESSVGRVGDTYDNALAETINGLYKTQVIRKRSSWKTIEEEEMETLKWVDWFDNRRLPAAIGNIPPAEAEENYYAKMDNAKMTA
jgi:hypothetical protein